MIYKTHKQYRLPGYDYSSSGDYFITICTLNRINYFGEITGKGKDAIIYLSPIGQIAKEFILTQITQ
jgi:putative transposase